jgi:hypothetical protein
MSKEIMDKELSTYTPQQKQELKNLVKLKIMVMKKLIKPSHVLDLGYNENTHLKGLTNKTIPITKWHGSTGAIVKTLT